MVRSPSRIWWVGALFALTLAGCYEDGEDQVISDRDGALPPDAAGCTVGERRPCDVVDGCGGSQACLGDGTYGPCVAPDEICDGVDNDCDGATDEEFPDLGDTCAAGEGACRDEGMVVCTPDGSDTLCDAQAGDNTDEVCDGVDNDCDGTTDEEAGAGVACETNLPGVCSAGVSACTDGDTVCEPSTEPSDETCDGLDNDCDTNVDEGENGGALAESCYEDGEGNAGPEGTEGVGACVAGVRMCSDGMFGACVDAVLPMAEVCDGVDNDCDGTIDNVAEGDCVCEPGTTEDCYDGPEDTVGVGVCQGGVRTCNETGTGYGECVGQRLPGVELCDGLDNDCNGTADDVSGVGEACMEGQGECMAEGERVCDPETGLVVCDAQPDLPGDEICDGLDNDCDGAVDDVEGAGENCEVGVGACLAGGVLVCDLKGGGLVCDAVQGDPAAEICDGIDNDCNGEIDDADGVGEDCAVGVGACRSTGVTACDPDGGGVICPATEQDQPSLIDFCDNGVDDDCDGETDEADCIIPCEVDDDCRGPGETCVDGACVFTGCETDDDCPDGQQCVDMACVDAEICDDGLDNDGDGATDCADVDCAEDPACIQDTGCGQGQVIGFGTYGAELAGDSVIETAPCALPPETTGPEAVFVFTPDAGGEVCVDTLGSTVDTVLTVRGEPCEADDSVIACNDDAGGDFETGSQVGFTAAAGTTYYFVADTFEGSEGSVILTVTDGPCAPVPGVEICDNEDDDDDDGLVDCLDEDCAGDPICQDPTLCDDAMPLDLGRTEGMAMGPSRTSAASCTFPVNGADGPEMVYAFVPDDGGTYCIDTRGSAIDTVLTVRGEPCEDPASEIACNDDVGMGFDAASEVEAELMDGATYYVIVDTFVGGGGDFVVNVREGGCEEEPVEICDDGFDNDGDGDVDCEDIACALDPACPILGDENCGDGVDNDGDGDVDCADADCALSPLCVEDCNNGIDDDGDDDIDCDDLDCLLDPICLLGPDEICDNGVDDDDDGLTDCADADCVDDPFCQQDYACEDAIPVGFGSVEGTLDGESRTSLASCTLPPNDAAGPDAVYVFTPAADGAFCVTTDTEGLIPVDTILTVRVDPCNDPDSEVACNDDAALLLDSDSEVTVVGTAGTPYYIVVDTYEGDGGDFTLNVTPGDCEDPQPFEICDNGVDDDGDDAIDCADPDCADDPVCAVDLCADAEEIGFGLYAGSTVGADADFDDATCGFNNNGAEAIYAFTADEAQTVCLNTNGSSYDTVLLVRTDPCADLANEVACDDDGGEGVRSLLEFEAEAGETYYIIVDGYVGAGPNNGEGDFLLSVQPGPCVEICDNGRTDDGDDLVDCADPDCDGDPACVETCDNGEDDDGDGDVDCADADCDGDATCGEICDNGENDDDDGDVDCADTECADDPACTPLDCSYGFEGDAFDPVFETDGDAPWTIEDGVATSGVIGNNQRSNLRVAVSTPAGGTVSFRYRVSSERPDDPADPYDYLEFRVDGARVGLWSGDVPFSDFEVELDPGDHVLEWSYIKDATDGGGEDRAQIDDLLITGAAGLCPPAEGDLRLVEGEDAQSGRLEVFHAGVWGTVCDDGWDNEGPGGATVAQGFTNADVACRQLGFVGAEITYDAPPGVDPTWMDGVACVGDEARLVDCPFNGFGDENCGHTEDIGVRCLTEGNCRIDDHCPDEQICVEGACVDGAREICDDGVDDDGDGDVDCADADCADDPYCAPLTCENARPIGLETQTVLLDGPSNYNRASCTFPPDGADGPDAVFVYSHGEFDPQTICIDTLGSTVDTVLTVTTEPCDTIEQACDDDSGPGGTSQVEVRAQPDVGTYIFVDTFAGESGEAMVTVTAGPCEPIGPPEICDDGADNDDDGLTDCADADCADDPVCNDPLACDGAPEIGFGTERGTLDGASAISEASCALPIDGAAGPEAIYAFVPDLPGTVCVDTLGSAADTILTVRTDACVGVGAEIACNDDADGFASEAEFDARAGATYYIVVDSYGGDAGDFALRVRPGGCDVPVPDELCIGGLDEDLDGLVDCDDPDCDGSVVCADPAELCTYDFEGGDFEPVFETDGDAPWTIEGGVATSGDIGNNQSSTLRLEVSTPAGGAVAFSYRVSSEAPGAFGTLYDYLEFSVDGVPVLQEAGEVPFTEFEIALLPGDHVLEWTYLKDFSEDGGEDRAQIDDVVVSGAEGLCDDGPVEICDNGGDDDGDGDVDCLDADCIGDPACLPDIEVDCDDGNDNDGDGDTDCADLDCAADLACLPEIDCEDGVDNDGDGDTDCADDDCAGDPVCEAPPCGVNDQEPNEDFATATPIEPGQYDGLGICVDGDEDFYAIEVCAGGTLSVDVFFIDDDGDLDAYLYDAGGAELDRGFTSTDDEDVSYVNEGGDTTIYLRVDGYEGAVNSYRLDIAVDGCAPPVEICDNGGDDDADGDVDCLDADCIGDPACLPDIEVDCDDGVDNDGDGDIDCADLDCAADLACLPEVDCDDGVDNDGDGDTDCADADCAAEPVCEVPPGDGAVYFLVNDGEFPAASQLYMRDGDGDATLVGPITIDGQPAPVESIALTPDGTLYGFVVTKGTEVITIDRATAEGTAVIAEGDPVIIDDFVFGAGAAPDGTIYLLMGFEQTVAPLLFGVALGEPVANLPTFFQFGDIAFDANGGCYLAGVDIAGDATGLYTCDLDAGTFDLLGGADEGFDVAAAPIGLAVGPGGDPCLGALYGSEVRGDDEYGVYDLGADPPLLTRAGAVGGDFAPPDFGDAAGWYTPPDDPACEVVAEICDNEIDDDGDGDVDCADPDCALDPACPPVAEICDNGDDDDLDGVADCDDPDCVGDPACDVPPLDGELIITEIMVNPAGSDTGNEWFELYNGTGEAIDLTGWTLRDDDGESEVLGPLVIESGAYLAFADGANPGFEVDYVFTQSIANGGDEIVLVDLDGVERAAVRYDDGTLWPWAPGFAMQFDARLDADAAANADPGNWCQATQRYRDNAAGDFGTPGEPNDPCGPVGEPVDFCRLQFPTELQGIEGDTFTVYGRFYEEGITDLSNLNDVVPGVAAELGYLAEGADPADPASWTWIAAIPNPGYVANDEANNDEYQAEMVLPAEGLYFYAFRFTVDDGESWTLCDGDGSGANLDGGDGTSFSLDEAGLMISEAVSRCREACEDLIACGFGAFAGTDNVDDCTADCEAGGADAQPLAACFADNLDPDTCVPGDPTPVAGCI